MKTVLCSLILTSMSAAFAAAAPEKVEPTKTWKGEVADESLQQAAPLVVASQKSLDALWSAWKQPGAAPQIDFTKEIVVNSTSRGSIINLNIRKDDGKLTVIGFGTRDLRPGFRFVMASVPREGLTTVNGNAIPKE